MLLIHSCLLSGSRTLRVASMPSHRGIWRSFEMSWIRSISRHSSTRLDNAAEDLLLQDRPYHEDCASWRDLAQLIRIFVCHRCRLLVCEWLIRFEEPEIASWTSICMFVYWQTVLEKAFRLWQPPQPEVLPLSKFNQILSWSGRS